MHSPEPEYTPFDVVETYAYKLANHWRVPMDAVIVRDQLSFRPQFLNGIEFVSVRLWDKPLMMIERELTRIARRRLSNIVLDAAILTIIKFLRRDDPHIMSAASYSGRVAQQVEPMIASINAYPPSKGQMTFQDIKSYYRQYQLRLRTEMKTIQAVIGEIHFTQERYRYAITGDFMRSSDLVVISESIRLLVEGNFEAEDVTSQFDSLQATKEIQHIAHASPSGIYQKIYVPKPLEHVAIGRTINMAAQMPSNSIAFTVTAISSYQMTYYVEEGYIEGNNIKSADKDTVINLCSSFLKLSLTPQTWQIRCQARLYPTEPRPFQMMMHYLLHMTVVDPKVYQLRLDESTQQYPIKSEYIMRYKPAWRPSGIGFPRGSAKQESMSTFSCPRLLSGNNYISIDIDSFTLSSVFRTLASLVPTICLYYAEHILQRSPLADLYNIPGLIRPDPPLRVPGKIEVSRQLHDEWPQIFTTAYLASVSGVRQLVRTTTNPLEANEWSREIITQGSKEEPRRVAAFYSHDGNILFWYTSISPGTPFVGLAVNSEDVNPLYPEVPASFVSASGSRTSAGSGKETGVSLKALRVPGKEGDAPETLDIVLGIKVKRSYAPVGPDAFLHAVRMAVMTGKDEEYRSVNPQALALAQRGAEEVRREMLALQTEVYKQQFYDVSSSDIIDKLRNLAQYIDPLLYCAGLEHLFGIDIYVITPTTDKNISTHRLELPRHREFHCRSSQPRQCVVIYNNPGINSDMLLYPHCEIVKSDKTNTALFSPRISQRLLRIMEGSNNFMHSTRDSLHLSNCMRSSMYLVMEGGRPVSQLIDRCGKTRVVEVLFAAKGNFAAQTVSLFCFPMAPLNIPSSDRISACSAEWFEALCGSPPIGRSNIGLWGVHATSGETLYVRTTEPPNPAIPFINQDPLMLEEEQEEVPAGSSFVNASAARDRMAVIIREHLKWYFEVYSLYQGEISAERFTQECLGYIAKAMHEDDYYKDIARVTDVLPAVTSLDDVLDHINSFIPSIDGNRVLLHSEKYYRCMVYTLGKHSNAFSLSPSLTARRHIKGFYTSLYGFQQYPNTLLIAGRSPIAQPTQGKPVGHNNHVITELRSTLLGSIDPLIYDNNGVACLIQATQATNIGAAYTVCEEWHVQKKNVGYFSSTATEMPTLVVVYFLEDNELKPSAYLLEGETINDVNAGEPFYEMIFSDKKYFALMRLV